MKYLKIIAVVLVVCLIGGFGWFWYHRWQDDQKQSTAVVLEMRALSRWETSSFTIEKIIDSGNTGNVFQQFLLGNRILLLTHGSVIAGFDLENLPGNAVKVNGKSVEITLPAPQILNTSLDASKTRVYDRQQGLLVPANNNLESDALLSAQNSIRSAACSEGILNNAADNAKKQMSALLTTFGFSSVTITIPSGKCS